MGRSGLRRRPGAVLPREARWRWPASCSGLSPWLGQGQARGAGLWAPRGGGGRRCPPSTDFCRLRVAGSGASWRGHPLPTTLVASTANGPCVPCLSRPSPHTPPQMGRKPQAALLCRVRSLCPARRCGLRVGLSVLGGRLQAGGCLLGPVLPGRVLGDPIARPPGSPCTPAAAAPSRPLRPPG